MVRWRMEICKVNYLVDDGKNRSGSLSITTYEEDTGFFQVTPLSGSLSCTNLLSRGQTWSGSSQLTGQTSWASSFMVLSHSKYQITHRDCEPRTTNDLCRSLVLSGSDFPFRYNQSNIVSRDNANDEMIDQFASSAKCDTPSVVLTLEGQGQGGTGHKARRVCSSLLHANTPSIVLTKHDKLIRWFSFVEGFHLWLWKSYEY